MRLTLKLHPESHCEAVRGLTVDVAQGVGALALRYLVKGRVGDLLLPAVQAPVRTDELWRHTCFEAFVRGSAESYFEFNFAPSTRWAAYQFDSYRSGMRAADAEPSVIETQLSSDEYELRAMIPAPNGAVRLGLTAVIEDKNGVKSYWALAHPPGKPDFHHADGFALELP
jgi:hypothetical protein